MISLRRLACERSMNRLETKWSERLWNRIIASDRGMWSWALGMQRHNVIYVSYQGRHWPWLLRMQIIWEFCQCICCCYCCCADKPSQKIAKKRPRLERMQCKPNCWKDVCAENDHPRSTICFQLSLKHSTSGCKTNFRERKVSTSDLWFVHASCECVLSRLLTFMLC